MKDVIDVGTKDRFYLLADQVLYAGTNFFVVVFLGLISGVESVGGFALILTVSVLLHSFFVATILEPLTVFGSAEESDSIHRAFSNVAAVFLAVVAVAGLIVAASVSVLGASISQTISLGVAVFVAQAITLVHKRLCIVRLEMKRAMFISLRYSLGVVTCIVTLTMTHELTPRGVVAAITVGGTVASFINWLSALFGRGNANEILKLVRTVRSYVAWTLAASVPSSVSSEGIYWVAEGGACRAIVGSLKLFEQVYAPLSQIFITMSTADQVESGRRKEFLDVAVSSRALATRTKLYVATWGAYTGLVSLTTLIAFHWFGWPDGTILVALIAYSLVSLLAAYSSPRNVLLKSFRRPRDIALGYLLMSFVTIGVGIGVQPSTLIGLVLLLGTSWVVFACSLSASIRSLLKRPSEIV